MRRRRPNATRRDDDRAVSVAVTHVLTIGITTILVAGLLIAAGSLLDTERERGARDTLETTGERLSGQLSSVDRIAEGGSTVTVRVEHSRYASGSTYTIELLTGSGCSTPLLDEVDTCLRLSTDEGNVEVYVPVDVSDDDVAESTTKGGPIVIEYDETTDEISIESDRQ